MTWPPINTTRKDLEAELLEIDREELMDCATVHSGDNFAQHVLAAIASTPDERSLVKCAMKQSRRSHDEAESIFHLAEGKPSTPPISPIPSPTEGLSKRPNPLSLAASTVRSWWLLNGIGARSPPRRSPLRRFDTKPESKKPRVPSLSPELLPPTLCTSVAQQSSRLPLLVWLMLKHDPNLRDSKSRTLLHYAAAAGSESDVKLLRFKGANLNAQQSQLLTPLYMAAVFGHCTVVKLLIDAGADVDLADAKGYTPLMQAVRHGRISTVEVLMRGGANPNATDHEGYTSFDHVKMHSRRKMVERLMMALQASVGPLCAQHMS